MEEGIIKTAPDIEKAKSILKMVETTLEMIDTIDSKKSLIDDLRIIRNKISYNGFFVTEDYLERKRKDILMLIDALKIIIYKKL